MSSVGFGGNFIMPSSHFGHFEFTGVIFKFPFSFLHWEDTTTYTSEALAPRGRELLSSSKTTEFPDLEAAESLLAKELLSRSFRVYKPRVVRFKGPPEGSLRLFREGTIVILVGPPG